MPYKCKKKQKTAQAKHYEENKELYLKRARASTKITKPKKIAYINRVKTVLGCRRCGYDTDASALEFHHTDPNEKDYAVSRLAYGNWSIKRIKEEIRKCICVCANCHREIHREIKEGVKHDWEK